MDSIFIVFHVFQNVAAEFRESFELAAVGNDGLIQTVETDNTSNGNILDLAIGNEALGGQRIAKEWLQLRSTVSSFVNRKGVIHG